MPLVFSNLLFFCFSSFAGIYFEPLAYNKNILRLGEKIKRRLHIMPIPQQSPVAHIRRGDIFMADLSPTVGSEQGGVRPVVILQNDVGNKHSPTVICACITSADKKKDLPTHVPVFMGGKWCTALLEQIRTLDKSRLLYFKGRLPEKSLNSVELAMKVSLGI